MPIAIPERFCKGCKVLDGIERIFTPKTSRQVFHDQDCRRRYYSWFWKRNPHKCPLCGEIHIPGHARVKVPKLSAQDLLETASS